MTPPPSEPAAGVLARPASAAHPPIDVLVALHDRDVRSALRRVLGRSQDEDDLVQEVFTRLVLRLRQPGDLCVGAWLRGVAHNLAVDEIRRRRPVPVEEVRLDRPVASSAEDAVAGSDLYGRVVEGAYSLPERQRAALAAALGGAGVASVATRLGVSVHAAESLLTRARVGLRNHLATADTEAGSTRSSLAAVLAALGAALGVVLRRWRVAATVTVAGGALVAASFAPTVLGRDADAAPAPAASPTAAATAASATGDPGAGEPAGEPGPGSPGDTAGGVGPESTGGAPAPAATATAPPPETAAGADLVGAIVDMVDVGLPAADLAVPLAGACAAAAGALGAVAPVGDLCAATGATGVGNGAEGASLSTPDRPAGAAR